MKIKTIAIMGPFLIPLWVSAQSPITLTSTSEVGLKTGVYLSRVVNTASLTPPITGANKTWDYSSLIASPISTTSLISASTFSSTAVADTIASETVADNLSIPVSAIYDMDATGFFGAGAIITKQDYSLTSATGGKHDSLIVPAQVYKFRQNHLVFPASYDSTWKSNTRHDLKFIVEAPSVFLPNDSARKLSRTTITDSVVGWGTLSIPSFNKSSIPYPVLLVKEQTKTIDSFFLEGSAAPTILLQRFNVVQGQVSFSYSEHFYREGTLEPLLTIGYDTDYTYTNPSTANFTADNVQSGIEGESTGINNLSIYPNPTTAGIVQCSFNKHSESNWHLNVVNSLGQIIITQTISGTGNLKTEIDLSSVHSSGLYFINTVDEYGSMTETGRVSIIR